MSTAQVPALCSLRKPMYLFLNQILKPRGVRFQYVRTEAKRAIMMAGNCLRSTLRI